jgi:hypothetical protein
MSAKCPNCRHTEPLGAIFCRDCGAQLVYNEDGDTSKTENELPLSQTGHPKKPTQDSHDFAAELQSRLALIVLETKKILPLEEQEEITLGRAGNDQPIIPDIDLTPHRGYEAGVSRLHASIKMNNMNFSLIDLGSANGTLLNGKKIPPNEPQRIKNEDIITLGKLKLQFLIQSTPA